MCGTAAVLIANAVRVALAAQAEFVPLGHLDGGGALSAALAVSDSCDVVVGVSDSGSSQLEPTMWRLGADPTAIARAITGWSIGRAEDVSFDGGVIVGYLSFPDGIEAFRWSEPVGPELLGYLEGGARFSGACGVNASGSVIVGQSRSSRSSGEPFVWRASTRKMEPVGKLPGGSHRGSLCRLTPDGLAAVGSGVSGQGWEAMLWREGLDPIGLGDLPGRDFLSHARGVSAEATVIVGSSSAAEGTEAFRWTAQCGMIGLGDLPGGVFVSGANGISADGRVVVGDSNNTSRFDKTTAFIWDPISGMRDLKSLLETEYGLELTGWRLTSAHDISADGTVIVGQGVNPAGAVEAYRVQIPPFCYADCDDSSGHRVLDFLDFLEFQRRFALRDLYSDCDQNGVHDFFDFLCFQNHFAAGCE